MKRTSSRAFSLVEAIVSLSILAILAAATAFIAANRDHARDETAAVAAAPSAIDALDAALRQDGPSVLTAEIAAGGATRLLWRDDAEDGAPWRYAALKGLSGKLSVRGPLFVARLSEPQARADGRAVECLVTLSWLVTGENETAESLAPKLAKAKEICRYKTIVLAP